MKVKSNRAIFDSGKIYYANNGIIGLAPNLKTYEGYDGTFGEFGIALTPEEESELADYMINLWTKYKEKAVLLTLNKGETDAKQ